MKSIKYQSDGKKLKITLFLLLSLFVCKESHAETETVTLPTVVVEDQMESATTVQPPDSAIGTREKIKKATIDIQGGAEQISPYKAISMQPGVDIRSKDAFGLEVSHRIRGKSNRNIGETIEGLPIKGIGPGVGLSTMIDLENIESISLTKGAVPADSGFGYGSENGMVDMNIRRPLDEYHGALKQVFGSENFSRSYVRLDTGNVGDVAKAFFSGSYTNADKWKGKGQSPDDRKNLAFGISSPSDHTVEWELYGVYNEDNKHSYRGLTYEQTRNLSRYKDYDYNASLTGDSSEDINYYDYNRQHFETYTFFGKLKTPVTDQSGISFRPYYLNDEGYSYSGGNRRVIDWLVEHDTYGAVLEYSHAINSGMLKAGYWYQEDEPPGPPTSRKNRSTDGLEFLSWERLIKATNHKFSSPFVTAEKTFGATTLNAGLKYLWLTSPNLTSYDTTGIPDVSYEDALSMDTEVNLYLRGKTYELFLPNIGAIQQLSDTTSLRASYGKTYDTPQYSLGSQVISFKNRGLTDQQIQALWGSIEPEMSDNFDLGLNYTRGKGFIASTLFYSLVKHVGGSFYDPDLDFSYSRNTAEARSYGLEVAAGYAFTPNLDAGLSATYNRYEFTSDIEAAGGSIIRSKDHQIPDVPEFMANLSVNWKIKDLVVSPTVRYLGKRYADVENKYSVDEYFLVDLALSKRFSITQKQSLTLAASVTNLLDEDYISIISAADTSLGRDTPTYYIGAPRTFFVSLQYDF